MNESPTTPKLTLGVSSCLLGKPVRFDGGHKRDRYITDVFGKVFAFVPVCPEVETGMGVPRETIDLHGGADKVRLLGNETGKDRTVSMTRWSSRRVHKQDIKQVCGFVLKSKSPTCALKSARITDPTGKATFHGQGLFAAALLHRYKSIPVVEERDLNDPTRRDGFIVRVFACHRLTTALNYRPTVKKLSAFHQSERLLLDAHSHDRRLRLDRLLVQPLTMRPAMLRDHYARAFMATLAFRSTVAKNLKVMYDVYRALNKQVAPTGLKNCVLLIKAYGRGECRLFRPLSELRRCVKKCDIRELFKQSWLFPDEREVFLRSKT